MPRICTCMMKWKLRFDNGSQLMIAPFSSDIIEKLWSPLTVKLDFRLWFPGDRIRDTFKSESASMEATAATTSDRVKQEPLEVVRGKLLTSDAMWYVAHKTFTKSVVKYNSDSMLIRGPTSSNLAKAVYALPVGLIKKLTLLLKTCTVPRCSHEIIKS